jgi:hypothetical protein
MISLATPTAPTGNTAGNTLTVAQGSLSLAKYGAYNNQTIVVPQTNYKIGHFTLTGSTTEATNINTIYVDLSSNTTTITNLYVKYGTQQTTSIASPTAATTPGSTIPNNSYSVAYTLPAGQTIDVQVFGDINALASGTAVAYVRMDGTTANSVQSVKTNSATGGVTGQTITFGSGSFVGTQDPGTTVSQAVASGSPVTAGVFKFTAQNDAYTINELKFSLGATTSAGAAAAANSITSVALKDNATGQPIMLNGVAVTAPVQYLTASTGQSQYVAYFTGLGLAMPANTVKSLAVVLNLPSTLSSDTATTNVDLEPYLTYIKVANSGGTPSNSDTTSSLISTATVNKTYAFKAIPSVAYVGVDSHASTGSQVELYKYTVNAIGGPVTVKQLKFLVTVNNPAASALPPYLNNFVFFKNGVPLSNSIATIENMTAVTGGAASGSDLRSTNTIASNTVVVTFVTEDSVSMNTPATYQLKANVNNFHAATSTAGADSVSTYIPFTAGSDDTVTTAYSTFGGARLAATIPTSMFLVAPGTTAVNAPALIWSDGSASNPTIHNYTAGSSADWYDSYLILTAATTPENVVAQ